MAVFEGFTAQSRPRGLVSGVVRGLQSLLAALATWNETRRTRTALNGLSDRALEDIGLCRGDITRMTFRS